jgi:flagellar hook-basal body complex protein FliE
MQTNSVTQTSTIASLPDAASLAAGALPGAGTQKAPFSDLFQDALHNVQDLEQKASTAVQGLLDGSGVDVHTAMIATGSADTAFELALSVRNKAVASFQQLMSMQF